MLQIGSPKLKILSEKFDGLNYEGIHFHVKKTAGLTIIVSHDGANDEIAKKVAKQYIATLPELSGFYTNIQIVDENGRIF